MKFKKSFFSNNYFKLKLCNSIKQFSMVSKNDIKDQFSYENQSSDYDAGRPNYPNEMFEDLYKELKCKTLAMDIGTGTGQIAYPLSNVFENVIGVDISEKQLAIAKEKYKNVKNLSFKIGNSSELEKLVEDKNSVDLIIVGQAFHWFNYDKFYESAKKVLKTKGIIAICGYQAAFVKSSNYHNESTIKFYNTVKSHFEFDRTVLEKEYDDIIFPCKDIKKFNYTLKNKIPTEKLLTYYKSFSAYHVYKEKFGKNSDYQDPFSVLTAEFESKPEIKEVEIETSFFMKILNNLQ